MNGCGFRRLALAGLLLCASAARAEIYTVPLLVSSTASGEPQGVVRILNGADEAGTVTVHAIDDAGVRHGPATFALSASAAVEFTAADLASGNAAKGLSGGIGSRSGDVRLEIDTDLDIVPLAFVRAPDGALSAMHDTVRAASAAGSGEFRYQVPAFNPASDTVQASRLRLINPGDAAAAVTIGGTDDGGAAATGGVVGLTLPAGGARTLTAQQLEAGDAGLAGRLGAGTGRWRLTVAADRPLEVVNIVAAPTGYWSNLSTTAAPGPAPANLRALNERFVGRAVVYRSGSRRFTLNAHQDERFSETAESDGVTTTYTGRYGYEAIGPDAGRLTLTYDNGAVCRLNVYFDSRAVGWFASHCAGGDYPSDGYRLGGSWSVGDPGDTGGGTSYGAGDTVATLPTGSWAPDVTSGGSLSLSGGDATIRLDDGGYIEEGVYRYTCQDAGGCEVVNRQVRSGTIAQSAAGTPPGTQPPPADTSPGFASSSGPGDQSYTAGTAISPLTLPAATGGDGTLTYTLTPTVPGLSFDAATRRLTGTPSTAGTYDMTYTATDVDGDTATLRFSIAVQAAGGGPPGFGLHADNGRAEGLAWANGLVYVVDSGADRVFAYGPGGQREAAADFDLHSDNGGPAGIAWSGDSFHVVDGTDDKVYAYGADGRRNAAADFDLHSDNGRAEGIVHALGRFHVVDRSADRVFTYRSDGQRDVAADFDLHGDNGNPAGIAWATERFYVADATDDKVYAYTHDGQRDAAADFDLHDDNGAPAGIARAANGAFLVADATDDKVYAYGGGGETAYGVGDTVATLPTGFWTPDITSGGSFGATGGNVTIQLDNGGYIEEGDYRYTCKWAGGCQIVNREVWRGTIIRTASGTAPGSGASDDHGNDRAMATGAEAGSDTEGVLESGDVDYFRVEVDAPGTLEAYTSGGADTLGRLEDADGAVLGTNDDGGAGRNAHVSEDVSAGTYHVRIKGYSSGVTGDYTLHVRFTESDSGPTPPSGGTIRRLTDHEASDGAPSWSPDGLSIAFMSDRDSNWDVYVTDADGGNTTRLTDHDAPDANPSWSPDGRRIAFQSNRGDNWDVYVMEADGGNTMRLTDHDADDWNPSWSPDGRRIAFQSNRGDNWDVYVMEADGGNTTRLTDHDAPDANPSWSPDGRRIAFQSLRDGNPDVYVMDADGGGKPLRLTDHDRNEADPSWSPDGRLIAFISNRDGNWEIYVMDADGGNTMRLTDHDADDWNPSWSPDGRHIAFHSDRSGNSEVFVMAADGDGTVQYPQPRFSAGSAPRNQTYTVGTKIPALTLPAAGGGGPRIYSLSPEVPGLIFNADERELVGTPSTAGTYDMTYRVRDTDGDTDSRTFTIEVTEPDP